MQMIKTAGEIVRNGGIIIYPTDTAYGIGCRIDNENAVEKLFKIRRRSPHKATPVLVDSISMVEKWVDVIPQKAKEYMEEFWPGGLTLILQSQNSNIVSLVKGGTSTLGVRMPDHDDILSIIREAGVPIIGSSANFEGEKTPYAYDELNPELVNLVDFVVPGECRTKQASTVLDCTIEPYRVLREGAVKVEEILL